jgi:hypothetical protein
VPADGTAAALEGTETSERPGFMGSFKGNDVFPCLLSGYSKSEHNRRLQMYLRVGARHFLSRI